MAMDCLFLKEEIIMWNYIKNNKWLVWLEFLSIANLLYWAFCGQDVNQLVWVVIFSIMIAEDRIIKRIDLWFETLFLVDEESLTDEEK